MKISVTIFVILISTYIVNASVLDPVIENVVHLKASKPPNGVPGIWKKKTIWKPRWVKEWKSAKVMKPVWRKVWSPIQIREWVPIPKPPPGWDSISTPLAPVHLKPQKALLKGSLGQDSFGVQPSTKMLLWDPIPYPDSQQPPPPPPFPPTPHHIDLSCGKGRCDNTFSPSMNQQQILEIIGPRYQMSEYYQNPEYSESVNRLSRLSLGGNNWRLSQSHQNFQSHGGLKNYQELSEFLVPPKFQSLLENNFPPQQIKKHNSRIVNTPVSHSSERGIKNSFHQWIPLPSENKLKGHLITKEPKQTYKFQTSGGELHTKYDENKPHQEFSQNSKSINQTQTSSISLQPQADGDFIQEAQLVGEFHYSEFELPNLKPEHESQLNLRKKEQITDEPHQSKNIVGQENVQKTKPNQQFVTENKPKQTQKEIIHVPLQSQIKQPEVHNTQDKLRTHKKNISNFSSNSDFNFRQQEGTEQEISPIYKTTQNVNLTTVENQKLTTFTPIKIQENSLPLNHPFIQLMEGAVNTSEFQQQTEIYPVFENTKRVNPISIPSNHRFFQPSEVKPQEESFPSNNSNRLATVTTTKSEKSLFDKNSRVQLVFATTSDEYTHFKEELQKTTTTEPYEIIFSSSLPSTTGEATKSPLIIVTPVNSNKP